MAQSGASIDTRAAGGICVWLRKRVHERSAGEARVLDILMHT